MDLRKLFSTRLVAVTSTVLIGMGALMPQASADDPPANDSFLTPTQIAALPFSETLDISGATQAPGESAPLCAADKTVWYQFTAPNARAIAIDTAGSSFTTHITVYSGLIPPPVSTACSASNNYELYPTAGQRYTVRIGTNDPEADGLLNVSISNLASISGRVVDAAGDPVSDIEVFIQTTSSPWGYDWTYTDENGGYTFPTLTKGSYRIEFWDYSGNYIASWYHNVIDRWQAQTIEVTNQAITLDDQVMLLGGSIEGTFTNTDGSQPSACIYAYDSNGTLRSGAYIEAGESTFLIGGLPAQTYRLEVRESCAEAPFGVFETEWYEDAADRESATPIDVELSEVVDGIEVVVDPAPVPANDERANAIDLGSFPAQIRQGLAKATTSADDPRDCGIVGQTTWFSYEPIESERIFITNYFNNASIAVHSEAADGSLALVGCSSNSYWSPASLQIKEGTRYLFEVGATETGEPAGIDAYIFDSDGGGTVQFTPSNPCHIQCPYWNQERPVEQRHEDPCAPAPASPEGSWQDHRVTVPSMINGKVPYALGFTMDPTIDHDVWFCSVEPDAQGRYTVTYAANLATKQCDHGVPAIGCTESFQGGVQPGKEYIIRVYNWSDPAPVEGTYWFLGYKAPTATATAT